MILLSGRGDGELMQTTDFSAGGYRFINGVFQYSAGVAAVPGYRITRVRFMSPVPLSDGFRRIEAMLKDLGRPTTAFCACELRSPAPFSEQGFTDFNRQYVATLEKWKIFDGSSNPVARSNVCPEIEPPAAPSFHAFSFTVPDSTAAPSFVISGSGEAMEGQASYRERTVRRGETTAEAMREKAVFVLGQMENRMRAPRIRLGRHDGNPGLHGARSLSIPGGRDCPSRRRPVRPDLAFQPPSGDRS
jgi:hypothetical protein